MKVATLYRILV